MDRLLSTLDASALRVLAAEYEKIARKARARAADLDSIDVMRQQARERLDALAALPGLVSDYLSRGYSLEAARAAAARDANAPAETVSRYWRHWIRAKDSGSIQQRQALVAKLAARGLTNAEISDRTGLHPGSVSRILGRAFRRP